MTALESADSELKSADHNAYSNADSAKVGVWIWAFRHWCGAVGEGEAGGVGCVMWAVHCATKHTDMREKNCCEQKFMSSINFLLSFCCTIHNILTT